jgi:hypothetical protein
MAITFNSAHHVASAFGGDNGGTTGTFSSTGDDLLVIFLSYWTLPGTLTDSASNTWVHVGSTTYNSNSQEFLRCYYVKSMTTSGTHSITASGTGSRASVVAASFAGSHLTAPLDQYNGAGNIFQTTFQPGSITPSENNCLVIAAGCHDDNSATVNSSMTEIDDLDGQSNISMLHAYIIQTTAGAINPTFTTPSQSTRVIAEIVSFKAAAAGGSSIKTVNGLAVASVKTVNGLAIASVKTVNGLA